MPQATPAALPGNWLEVTAALVVVLTLAVGAGLVVAGAVRRLLRAALGTDTAADPPMARSLVRFTRGVTITVTALVLGLPALDLAGHDLGVGLDADELIRWLVSTGLRIALILGIAGVLTRIVGALATRAGRDLEAGTDLPAEEQRRRFHTIAGLVRGATSALLWTMAALMVLRELDIDITPLLTGAGVVGLAVGFGAQTLVRDVISGVFLIFENQVRLGDVVLVNGVAGAVEQINLRTLVLRDFEGVVHVVPNGEIRTLANRTKDYSYYVIELGVDYDEDSDRVVAACEDAARELQQDPRVGPWILEPLEVAGIDAFTASQVTLKMRIKTVPLRQWDVGRELRRRIARIFRARGIRTPFPQFTVTLTSPPPAAH